IGGIGVVLVGLGGAMLPGRWPVIRLLSRRPPLAKAWHTGARLLRQFLCLLRPNRPDWCVPADYEVYSGVAMSAVPASSRKPRRRSARTGAHGSGWRS